MKHILILLAFCSLSISFNAQTSFTLQSGLFMNELEGGFVNTTSIKGTSLSIGLSIDHTRGRLFGWSCAYSAFNKSFEFGYPITTTGTIPQDGHYATGYVVRAHELQSAFLMRLGKHINLSAGPYVQINTNDIIAGMGVDEDFYYPSLPQDLYNSIEFGYQGKLQVQFFLGNHFYFGGFANTGASVTDLRTKAWNDAWSFITGQQEEWDSTPVKNVYQHYGIFIGLRTKQKDD
jgi:hypothetical protein